MQHSENHLTVPSPVGDLTIWESGGQITRVEWTTTAAVQANAPALNAADRQLSRYFSGDLTEFDLPLSPRGNAFQKDFYEVLCAIPFGHTRTYGDIAKEMGVSAQAIGQACGANPIPIFIPCHRVLGAAGLGGFSGGSGIEAKVALLKLEGSASLLL